MPKFKKMAFSEKLGDMHDLDNTSFFKSFYRKMLRKTSKFDMGIKGVQSVA